MNDKCSRCGYPRTRTACARCLHEEVRKTSRNEPAPDSFGEENPTDGLPADLAALLRDPSIIVPQDAAVFELVARWMDAPSDTASAMTVDEWRQAWSATCRRMLEARAECEQLRSELRAYQEKYGRGEEFYG